MHISFRYLEYSKIPYTTAADVPIEIKESILGLPLTKDLNPTLKNLFPTNIIGITKISCINPKFKGLCIGSIILGNFNPIILPIDIVSKGTANIKEVINLLHKDFIASSFPFFSSSIFFLLKPYILPFL